MKLLHRLWLGPAAMPEAWVEYGNRWRELNPDWVVHLWTEDDLPPLENQPVYDDILGEDATDLVAVATQRADVVSYELVWRYGGVYVNCDIEPIRPLSYLSVGTRPWASYEDDHTGFLVNAAMGGQRNDPFWAKVVHALPYRYWPNRRGQMNEVTGPHLLTQVYQEHGRAHGFRALPYETFCPVHFHDVPWGGDASGLFDPEALPAETIGVHHWGHRLLKRSNLVAPP